MTVSKTRSRMNLSPSQTFLHGIDLSNWHPCHNLRLSNTLSSPNCTDFRVNELNQHKSITNANIDELRSRNIPSGFIQPRLGKVLNNDSSWNLEIDFEDARRKYCTESPSRLSCLYLCDYSDNGRIFLKEMFPKHFICKVKVKYFKAIHRADVNWFNEYVETLNHGLLKKYWAGEASENPMWEYLVDGIIEFIDDNELTYIRQNGALLPDKRVE